MNKIISSIIIPTHNRGKLLIENLKGLANQSVHPDTFQVIIIADNCSDNTFNLVEEYSAKASFRIDIFKQNFSNAAASRNFGASKASGEYLIFIDDDILPCPQFIEEHLKSIRENSVVIGYSKPVYNGTLTFWQLRARRWWEDRFFDMALPYHRFTFKDFFSGNLSMHSSLFRNMGGFNATLSRLEDYELGLRMIQAGIKFIFSEAALGYHFEDNDLEKWLSRLKLDAEAHVIMSQKFPGVRSDLFENKPAMKGIYLAISNRIKGIAFKRNLLFKYAEKLMLLAAYSLEFLRLRGIWDLLIGSLMEYNYWSGIAKVFQSQADFDFFLNQNYITGQCIEQDYSIKDILEKGDLHIISGSSISLTSNGNIVLKIPPDISKENINENHLKHFVIHELKNTFIPDVAATIN